LDSVPRLIDEALDLLRDSDTAANTVAACLLVRARWLLEQGEAAASDSVMAAAAGIAESAAEPDARLRMRIHSSLAYRLHRRFLLEEAEREYREALRWAEEAEVPTWSVSMHRRLASLYAALPRPDDALFHADAAVSLAPEDLPRRGTRTSRRRWAAGPRPSRVAATWSRPWRRDRRRFASGGRTARRTRSPRRSTVPLSS
jgi:tetratricopeptide (TPR) repeat protein